jgi:futalosine hydrolase
VKTLLVAATRAEIQPFLDHSPEATDVLITGLGLVATTFELTRKLEREHYDLVVQGGVAGAISSELEVGQLVQITKEHLLDFGAEDRDGNTLSVAEMGFPFAPPHSVDGGLAIKQSVIELPYRKAVGGTVQRGSGSKVSIERLRRQYPFVEVETMEGAALAYVCARYEQPALQLRSISNYVTERDRDSWQLGLAITNLNEALGGLFDRLTTVREPRG